MRSASAGAASSDGGGAQATAISSGDSVAFAACASADPAAHADEQGRENQG